MAEHFEDLEFPVFVFLVLEDLLYGHQFESLPVSCLVNDAEGSASHLILTGVPFLPNQRLLYLLLCLLGLLLFEDLADDLRFLEGKAFSLVVLRLEVGLVGEGGLFFCVLFTVLSPFQRHLSEVFGVVAVVLEYLLDLVGHYFDLYGRAVVVLLCALLASLSELFLDLDGLSLCLEAPGVGLVLGVGAQLQLEVGNHRLNVFLYLILSRYASRMD